MKTSGMARVFFLLVALAMIIMISGCQFILPKEDEPLAPPLDIPSDIVYQTVDTVKGDIMYAIEGMARVECAQIADVYFEAAGGRIKSIDVTAGQMVKKGDVLMELKTSDLEYQLSVARIRLQMLQNTYDGTKKRMDKVTLKNTELELLIAKLSVQQLEQQKAEAILRAPVSGQVIYVAPTGRGGAVDAYSTLVRIADQSKKIIEYKNVSQSTAFQVGAKVEVLLYTDQSRTTGEVAVTPFSASQVDLKLNEGTIYIKVPDEFLANSKVGDQATIKVVIAERKDVLKIPLNALKNFNSRRYVDVLVNGIKEERSVQVGLQTPSEAEIVSGLQEGEKVIVGS